MAAEVAVQSAGVVVHLHMHFGGDPAYTLSVNRWVAMVHKCQQKIATVGGW